MNYLVLLVGFIITFQAYAIEHDETKVSGDRYLGVVGSKTEIDFGSTSCSVEAKRSENSEFYLELSCDGKDQILWDINHPAPDDFSFDDPKFELLWAGDRDGDGKIDIEMEMSPKYSCRKKVLYLSSLALEGQLVGIYGSPKTTCPD